MTQHFMPFGAGTRVCGGQNLAQIVLKIVAVAMIRNFNVSANPSETNERTMEVRDAFVSDMMTQPKKCAFLTLFD